MQGRLETLDRRGEVESVQELDFTLNPTGPRPSATFLLRSRFGKILRKVEAEWRIDEPARFFVIEPEDAEPILMENAYENLADTEINWMDLSFSSLWWQDPESVGEDRKLGRTCRVVDVVNPDPDAAYAGARLWIDPEMNGVLETEYFDRDSQSLKKLRIKRLRKVDGAWFPNQMEALNTQTYRRTQLTMTSTPKMQDPAPEPVAPVAPIDPQNVSAPPSSESSSDL